MLTSALWRFDETIVTVRPQDAIGNVGDLTIDAVPNLVMPTIVDAAMGRGRRFVAATHHGMIAQDVVSGTTLLQRDCSVQAIVQWNLAAQNTAGFAGTLYARGKSGSAAERVSAAVELYVVNNALNVGGIRWRWQDGAGVDYPQDAGYFTPSTTDYMLLTATRRWISATSLVLRYYLGSQLLAEILSVDGAPGGGTTGTTQVGARSTNGVAYSWFLDGVIDEMRVVDYELSAEEIEATWRRITIHQPRGYALVKELHDPGFPISDDPASRVQLETRMWGHGLGFASAQAENMRNNILPDRSYGAVLESWERITAQPFKPGDSIDARQARVSAHIRQDLGVSIPGIGVALRELVATDPANLQILAFDQTTVDDYTAAITNTGRWYYDAFGTDWQSLANQLRLNNAAGLRTMDGTTRTWSTARMCMSGSGASATILAKLLPTTITTVSEVGVWFGDMAHGNYVLFGLRNTAGVYQFFLEFFAKNVSQGAVMLGAGALATTWLKLTMQDPSGFAQTNFTASWSTTDEAGPYTDFINNAAPNGWLTSATRDGLQYAGLYGRTISGAVQITVDFDNVKVRTPSGDRSFYFYVYRDPALPGSSDILAANAVLQGLKQAHTIGAVCTAKVCLCDDPNSLCDLTPCGAI